jgi:hypothetical protein
MATIDTTGIANVAFFTAHVPTEFERDKHYFMSTDLTTDNEPVSYLGAAAAHVHRRSLSSFTRNDRHSKRRLATPGTCCTTAREQGAWKQVVAYHDECDHDQVPPYIEVGFHDYEASCENHFCNLIGPGIDQTVCPYAPPAPPLSPPYVEVRDTGISNGALVGVIVAGVVVALLYAGFICYMVRQEKQGKPVFTSLTVSNAGKGTA